MRPKSLAEVAELAREGEPFHLCLKNFPDEFYLHPTSDALVVEPKPLKDVLPESGVIYDAYLAATAESLAAKAGFDTPSCSYSDCRKLRHPWFAMTLASLRAVLLVESPAAFRSRNLFVSENALSRA